MVSEDLVTVCVYLRHLREPQSRYAEVDLIVTNGSAKPGEYQMKLVPDPIYNIADPALNKTCN